MPTEGKSGLTPPHLYNVLAFTAHEVRALTYAAMVPRMEYTVTPLHKRVMSLQGSEPSWELRKNAPHEYCRAFAELGLVAVESVVVKKRSALAYVIAEEPRSIVLPFLGHLLDISLNAEQSLIEIFGRLKRVQSKLLVPVRIGLLFLMLSSKPKVKL